MMKVFAMPIAIVVHTLLVILPASAASAIKFVFVITMENTDSKQIYGKPARAPYLNNIIIPKYARAANFDDPLPKEIDSEPHYLWMEGGTNAFSDHTFLNDGDPSAANSTASKDHLVTQMKDSGTVTWMTYQQDINSKTGLCPVVSNGLYAAKHNPFVFFQDVSGNPPRKDNDYCRTHTKPYSAFATDLAANMMANYVFITPNLCNDMHGDKKCPKVNRVTAGDRWLRAELPRMIDWVTKNSGVIFIVWDEGSGTTKLPFFAIGPGVKANHLSTVTYNQGSLVRSVEEIFNLPILPKVSMNNNLSDMFKDGFYP
jgi:phosphatidylinositol-3-phosphatase